MTSPSIRPDAPPELAPVDMDTALPDTAEAKPALVPASAARPKNRRLASVLSLDDFEIKARSYLPRMVHGFIAGSVETGAAYRAAADAYLDYSFIPRTFTDVSARSTGIRLFDREYGVPFGIAPIGGAAIAAYRGDLALAEGAAATRQPMIMSASSLIRLEEVQRAYPAAWFQAYLAGDHNRIAAMVARVERAGFDTLVITADTPVPGNRENNVRSGYNMPIRITPRVALDCALHPRWLLGTIGRTFRYHGMPYFENMDAGRGPPMFSRNFARDMNSRDRLSWSHIEWIRANWRGRLVIKGLLAVEDVRRARDIGVDGVILSSHGGRQLDHAVAPLRVLPQIRREVPDITLMIDGGIRRGTDILKALALGASAVFVGRPYIFAASLAGAAGVLHASALLQEEVSRGMALLGVTSLDNMSTDRLVRNRPE